jgi:hypothetical protein
MALLNTAVTAARPQSPLTKYSGLRPATPTRMGRALTPSRAAASSQKQRVNEKRPLSSGRQRVVCNAVSTSQLQRASDCFSTLGISSSASASEIRQAYRSLAKKYHPDVNSDGESSLQFVRLRSAYEMCLVAEASQEQEQLHNSSPLRKMSRTKPVMQQRPSPVRTRRAHVRRDAWDDIWDEMLSSPKQGGRRRRSTS